MNEIIIYDDMDRFDEIFGDLDMSMLYSNELHHIFVYGTLMSGMRNHHRLESAGSKLICKHAFTKHSDFKMLTRITDSGYPAPIVIRQENNNIRIAGEVYEISNSLLEALDVVEGHPDVYKRTRVAITNSVDAWMYMYANDILCFENMDGIVSESNGGIITAKWVGK